MWSCELRFHGESYGWEAQILREARKSKNVRRTRARGIEPRVTHHVRERRRGRVQDGARRRGRLNQEDVWA